MKITVKSGGVADVRADCLTVPLVTARTGEGGKGKDKGKSARPPSLPRGVAALDQRLGGVIKAALASGDVKGTEGERLVVYPTTSKPPVGRVLLLGVGPANELDPERLRRLAARACSEARDRKHERIAILARRGRGLSHADSAAALTEGALLGAYRFDRHQAIGRARGNKRPAPHTLSIWFDDVESIGAVRSQVARAVIGAESQLHARDLSNAPPNEMPPLALAADARAVAREAGLRCKVLRGADLERLGLRALMAVGGGSVNPPCLIVMEHKGRGRGARKRPVCIVGKGITFDSGGLSLKPSNSMLDMKHDMSGAATVIATMRAVGLLEHPEPVIGLVAAAENMPSGTAYRPSDIVTAASGKTIEVQNTDAEGRVVLADALHYALENYSPRVMVDLATLTGAAMIAFGPWATAAMGNDESVVDGLCEAGEAVGERVWPMPLLPEHRQAIKSSVADIKNTGGPQAGVSTAGAFLGEFVGETPWAHLDMAGSGFTATRTPTHRGGATGVGVRMLVEWLQNGVQRFA